MVYEHGAGLPGLMLLRLELGVMSVLSWLRLAVTLWLLRRAARGAGVAPAGRGRRGGMAGDGRDGRRRPGRLAARLAAVRLRRTAAEALLVTAVWLFAAALHASGWRTLALIPVRDGRPAGSGTSLRPA